ncbi:hypothetical protein GGX14DRAFT_481599 [Mycena pura]|uniref:DUF202 domain-containing protein n=1 Tax=Mycena pura TaxID=153505 RepID=A0AAD6Y4L7_9AGAR|nr:hypothetical protein GGX14DRAFT_481599 [Mycena pura]
MDEHTPLLHNDTEPTPLSRSHWDADGDQNAVRCHLSPHSSCQSVYAEIDAPPAAAEEGSRNAYMPCISLVLQNSGSVARDHLASERTFLAYVRTSLMIASAGVAIAQLPALSERLKNQVSASPHPFGVYARPLAAASIILALYVLCVGVSRYFSIQSALPKGKFPVTRIRVAMFSLVLGAIITTLFALIITMHKDQQ